MQFMVIYMYAIKEKNMIIVLCTLFMKKDTCIMVRITAVGIPGGERGGYFSPCCPLGAGERNGASKEVQWLP